MNAADVFTGLVLSGLAIGLILAITRLVEHTLGVNDGAAPRRLTPMLTRARNNLPTVRVGLWVIASLIVFTVLLSRGEATLAVALSAPLLLGAGLALRTYFANVVGGISLALERPFKLGDRIHVDGIHGIVRQIRLNNTLLELEDGEELRVPNGLFMKGAFKTVSRAASDAPVDVELPVPERVEVKVARESALLAATLSRYASPRKRPEVFVTNSENGVRLKLHGFSCTPGLVNRYRSEVLEIYLEAVSQ